MGQHHRPSHHLIRVARIDPQPNGDVHRLVELGEGGAFDQGDRLGNLVLPVPVDLGHGRLEPLSASRHQSTTSSPMDRAVPAIIRMALARSEALRSAILISAIFLSWARVTLPTLVRLGWPLPFSMPASLSRRLGAGGVLVMKVNVRSAKIVTTTGITIPLWLWVRALNCFTNSMMFTPCGPSAVPTGGAGVAAPAGHCSLTIALIFFAIASPLTSARLGDSRDNPRGGGEERG